MATDAHDSGNFHSEGMKLYPFDATRRQLDDARCARCVWKRRRECAAVRYRLREINPAATPEAYSPFELPGPMSPGLTPDPVRAGTARSPGV